MCQVRCWLANSVTIMSVGNVQITAKTTCCANGKVGVKHFLKKCKKEMDDSES